MMMVVGLLVAIGVDLKSARGQDAARQVAVSSWPELQRDGALQGGQVLPSAEGRDFPALRIAGGRQGETRVQVLAIDRPAITTTQYALRGQVRCTDVAGEGYLEMLSAFGEKEEFFSRALSPSGGLRKLNGSCGWRRFVLPFFMDEGQADRPTRLTLNVVLPGQGAVELGPVELVEYDSREAASADVNRRPDAWWSDPMAGWIGGGAGVLLGVLGAVVGLLAPRGKARGFSMAVVGGMMPVGVVGIVTGVVAVLRAQPYAVYYPLLLIGGLCTVLSLVLAPRIRRQYEAQELRRMQALDAGRA